MTSRTIPAGAVDASAVLLSGLCLVHCLALPLMIAFLPAVASVAEAEWLHRAFVLLALPVTGLALVNGRSNPVVFAPLAVLGMALLIAGAFVHAFHDYEAHLTVAGGLMLAGAHVLRWRTRSPAL